MGEIAEMMLEGIICEGCGEFLGDAAGHPQRCAGCGGNAQFEDHFPRRGACARHAARNNRNRHKIAKESKPFECHCGKLFKIQQALDQHKRDRHPGVATLKKRLVCECGSRFRTSEALAQHRGDKHCVTRTSP